MYIYKTVKYRELYDTNPIAEFEAFLNSETDGGWELHSVVPQISEGEVYCNVVIFKMKVEE